MGQGGIKAERGDIDKGEAARREEEEEEVTLQQRVLRGSI